MNGRSGGAIRDPTLRSGFGGVPYQGKQLGRTSATYTTPAKNIKELYAHVACLPKGGGRGSYLFMRATPHVTESELTFLRRGVTSALTPSHFR